MGRSNRNSFNESITFDETVILIGQEESSKDEFGNPIKNEKEKTIFCNEKGVFRNEFYQAGSSGLKPSYTLTIHKFEYDNEVKVKYKGLVLDILRIFPNGNLIELTVGEKIGN